MNEFLTDLSTDSPLLWALFVVGVVVTIALLLSVVSSLLLRLGSAFAGLFRRRETVEKDTVGGDDVVS